MVARFFVSSVLIGLVAATFLGCAQEELQFSEEMERELPLDQAENTALAIIDAWTGEQFDEVAKHLAPPHTEARSATALEEKWTAKTVQGAYKRRSDPKMSRDQHGEAVAEFDLEFEHANFHMKMIFNRDGQLDDYFMSLAPE